MGKVLPTLAAIKAFQNLGLKIDAELQHKMRKAIRAGLKRLYELQHSDGGWGWWKRDRTNPFMTAYVVLGLVMAREADVVVREDVIKRGIAALERMIKSLRPGKGNYNRKCYMVWVLAKAAPQKAKRYVDVVFDDAARRKATPYTKALLAMALLSVGREKDASAVVDALLGEARRDENGLFWRAAEQGYRRYLDPVETTAYCARALVAAGKMEEANAACAWLLSRRHGNKWRSTRDTAAAVLALLKLLSKHKITAKKVDIYVSANSKIVLMRKIAPDKVYSFSVDASLFRKGKNRITVKGAKGLVCSVSCEFHSARIVQPDKGLALKRRLLRVAPEVGKPSLKILGEVKDKEKIKRDEWILGEVELTSEGDYRYIVVEVPLPAGCEVVESATRRYCRLRNWWLHREVWDDKVVFFLNYVGRGQKVKMSFLMRGAYKGRFRMPPARAFSMYFPELCGHSDALTVEVTR